MISEGSFRSIYDPADRRTRVGGVLIRAEPYKVSWMEFAGSCVRRRCPDKNATMLLELAELPPVAVAAHHFGNAAECVAGLQLGDSSFALRRPRGVKEAEAAIAQCGVRRARVVGLCLPHCVEAERDHHQQKRNQTPNIHLYSLPLKCKA